MMRLLVAATVLAGAAVLTPAVLARPVQESESDFSGSIDERMRARDFQRLGQDLRREARRSAYQVRRQSDELRRGAQRAARELRSQMRELKDQIREAAREMRRELRQRNQECARDRRAWGRRGRF
jgi:chromosome segregation ATPase